MEYRFEGTDRFPDIMFTDDKIQDAKGNECYYNDIEKIGKDYYFFCTRDSTNILCGNVSW